MASTTVKYVARDQKFTITLSGLMPLTAHYAYIDNKLIASSNIKPLGGNLGDQLKTDRNGQLTFEYFYNGGVLLDTTPWAEAQKTQASLVAAKRIVVGNLSAATLDPNYTSSFLSYATSLIEVASLTTTHETTPAAVIKKVLVPGPVYYDYSISI